MQLPYLVGIRGDTALVLDGGSVRIRAVSNPVADALAWKGDAMLLDEHSRDGLLEKLARDCHATSSQLALAERLLDLYAEWELLQDGKAKPLYCTCPAASECWAGVPEAAFPPPDRAEITLPWVGRFYPARRVCAVAINLNKYGALGGQWWIANAEINDRLKRGKRRNFGYQVGRYLAAVVRSLEQRMPEPDDLDPDGAAIGWESCAFLESVKCSPMEGVSKPTDAMRSNCPPRYLAAELKILAPSIVLAVGKPAWEAVGKALTLELKEQQPGFARGVGALGNGAIDVLLVNHPSYGHWRTSLPELLRSLSQRSARLRPDIAD